MSADSKAGRMNRSVTLLAATMLVHTMSCVEPGVSKNDPPTGQTVDDKFAIEFDHHDDGGRQTTITINRGEYVVRIIDLDGDNATDRWELLEKNVLRSRRWTVDDGRGDAGELYDDTGEVAGRLYRGHLRESQAEERKRELRDEIEGEGTELPDSER